MSYILDALKKSEQERQQQQTPGLQTIQRSHRHNPAITSRFKPWIILCSLIVLLFSVSFYFQPEIFNFIGSPPMSVVNKAGTNDASLPEAEAVAPVTEATIEISPQTPLQEPVKAIPLLMEFWQLPDPVQQQIPPMTFSFHVYSANADRRTIIINNRRIKEGGVVSAGLVLEEVTPEGVILNWQDQYRFVMEVVSEW